MPDSVAKKAWKAKNTTRVVMDLNNNTDVEIIRKLASVESKQGYIKELIRKDLGSAE